MLYCRAWDIREHVVPVVEEEGIPFGRIASSAVEKGKHDWYYYPVLTKHLGWVVDVLSESEALEKLRTNPVRNIGSYTDYIPRGIELRDDSRYMSIREVLAAEGIFFSKGLRLTDIDLSESPVPIFQRPHKNERYIKVDSENTFIKFFMENQKE